MSSAPDYPEPVTGWRLWVVAREHGRARLASPVTGSPWPVGQEAVADCDAVRRELLRPWRRHPTDHAAPGWRCGCGLHAMRRPGYLATLVPPVVDWLPKPRTVPRAVGRVALWGRVLEGTRGWRASHAYPTELWVPELDPCGDRVDGLELIALDLLDYGVQVHICDGMTPREVIEELSCDAANERRAAAA